MHTTGKKVSKPAGFPLPHRRNDPAHAILECVQLCFNVEREASNDILIIKESQCHEI